MLKYCTFLNASPFPGPISTFKCIFSRSNMNTRNIFLKSEWDIQEYLPALKCVCRRQQTLRVSLPPTACIRHDEEPGAAPGGESRLHPAGVVALRHRSRQQQRPVVVSLNRCCCCCCSLNVMMLSLSSHSKSRLVSLPQRPFLFLFFLLLLRGQSVPHAPNNVLVLAAATTSV